MQQETITSPASSSLAGLFQAAWPQVVIAGTVTLIPIRTYPSWLRRTLMWGPATAATLGATFLAANPGVLAKVRQRTLQADKTFRGTEGALPAAAPQESAVFRSPAALVATGASAGAVMSLSTAFGFWADEKIERGLRRLRLPYPRVIMAVGVGAAAWWQARQDQQKALPR